MGVMLLAATELSWDNAGMVAIAVVVLVVWLLFRRILDAKDRKKP